MFCPGTLNGTISDVDYFIDECGHTGDLAKPSAMFGFENQPIFSLAAVGVPDVVSLNNECRFAN